MILHIFSSLQGYPGKWAYSLPERKDITMSDLLAYMDHTFGNVYNCATMIRCLYKIHQKEGETVEEYMLWIHKAVVVIHHAYLDHIADQGKNLMMDQFYYRLLPGLRDALSFAIADLPKQEQANMSFDTLYMLAKKFEEWGSLCFQKTRAGSTDTYRDQYQRYHAPTERVVTLGEEKLFLLDPQIQGAEAPDTEPPEFKQIEGLNSGYESLSMGGAEMLNVWCY